MLFLLVSLCFPSCVPASLTGTAVLNSAVDDLLAGLGREMMESNLWADSMTGTFTYRWVRLNANLFCTDGSVRTKEIPARSGEVFLADLSVSDSGKNATLEICVRLGAVALVFPRCDLDMYVHHKGAMTISAKGPPISLRLSLNTDTSSSFCTTRIENLTMGKFHEYTLTGDEYIIKEKLRDMIIRKMNGDVKNILSAYFMTALAGRLTASNLCAKI